MIAVTFDSNTYRRVVEPNQFLKDPLLSELQVIHAALKDRRICGFLSETLATLEGIQKAQRGPYFSKIQPKIRFNEKEYPDGKISVSMTIEPKHSLHPGLHPIVKQWITDAVGLGFSFLRVPRIGVPRPAELTDNVFKKETAPENKERLQRFGDIEREIEKRGVGVAIAKTLGENINKRLNVKEPWFFSLDQAKDLQEENKIKKAIGEWADGDTVAAHYAYGIDYLCSEDIGKSSGKSVFDNTNRTWLEKKYNIQFVSLIDLAAKL